MSEIMFDKDGVQVVLLSREFHNGGRHMAELRAHFTETGPALWYFFQDAQPQKHEFTREEADAFCEAWIAYRNAHPQRKTR